MMRNKNPTPHTLQDGLAQILGEVVVKKPPEVLSVTFDENQYELQIVAVDPGIEFRLASLNTFYLELRRKVREITSVTDWSLRYASQITSPLLPFLHSTHERKVIIDPMLPYRNPIIQLSMGEVVCMYAMPSRPHYFHSLASLESSSPQNSSIAANIAANIAAKQQQQRALQHEQQRGQKQRKSTDRKRQQPVPRVPGST